MSSEIFVFLNCRAYPRKCNPKTLEEALKLIGDWKNQVGNSSPIFVQLLMVVPEDVRTWSHFHHFQTIARVTGYICSSWDEMSMKNS